MSSLFQLPHFDIFEPNEQSAARMDLKPDVPVHSDFAVPMDLVVQSSGPVVVGDRNTVDDTPDSGSLAQNFDIVP